MVLGLSVEHEDVFMTARKRNSFFASFLINQLNRPGEMFFRNVFHKVAISFYFTAVLVTGKVQLRQFTQVQNY